MTVLELSRWQFWITTGVVTGIVQESQFGMNWSAYSKFYQRLWYSACSRRTA